MMTNKQPVPASRQRERSIAITLGSVLTFLLLLGSHASAQVATSSDATSTQATSTTQTSTSTNATSTGTTATSTANLSLSSYGGLPNTFIQAFGSGFGSVEDVSITLGLTTTVNILTDTSGNFDATFEIPDVPTGAMQIVATGPVSGKTASNSFFVLSNATSTNATSTGTTATSTATSTGTTTGTTTSTTTGTSTHDVFLSLTSYSGAGGTSIEAIGSEFNPNETVTLSLGTTTTTVVADGFGGFNTPITIPLSSPSGNLFIFAVGGTSGLSALNSFYVTPFMSATTTGMETNTGTTMATTTTNTNTATTTGTSTATTTTDLSTLSSIVAALQAQVAALQNQVNSLLSNFGLVPRPVSGATASIDPVGPVRAGGQVNFGGRNFGTEESVQVTSDGALITTAHADGGGNFSTGSLSVPNTPGTTKTYTFTGMNSGIVKTVTVTITP